MRPAVGQRSISSFPTLMHTWQWHTWQNLPYLSCSLLADWPHGFFTHHFWPRLPAALTPVLHSTAQTYRVKQVHGNAVLAPSEIAASGSDSSEDVAESGSLPQADGLMTEFASQAVWVCTADCTPVLIADCETGQVAAIHAGWRGTAAQIVPQAVARLQAQGSQLKNLRVAMGPAIAGEVYQVSEEVAAEVATSLFPQTESLPPETILEKIAFHKETPVLPDPQPGKVRLDVRHANTLQLKQLGLTAEQIAIAPHCTYQEPDRFFSYRRDGQKKVQWSGIVSIEREPEDLSTGTTLV